MNDGLFVVSNAEPGREADYVKWYVDRHLPDVVAVPGVSRGAFYRAVDPKARWAYAARYALSKPFAEVMAEVFARAGTEKMPVTDAIDLSTTVMLGATPQRAQITAEAAPNAKDGELCIVLGDASIVKTLQAWWDDRSVPSPIASRGVLTAQPFATTDLAGGNAPWTALALYDIAGGKGLDAMAALTTQSGSWRIPSMAKAENLFVGLYERIAAI
jgi:hypothetical protein